MIDWLLTCFIFHLKLVSCSCQYFPCSLFLSHVQSSLFWSLYLWSCPVFYSVCPCSKFRGHCQSYITSRQACCAHDNLHYTALMSLQLCSPEIGASWHFDNSATPHFPALMFTSSKTVCSLGCQNKNYFPATLTRFNLINLFHVQWSSAVRTVSDHLELAWTSSHLLPDTCYHESKYVKPKTSTIPVWLPKMTNLRFTLKPKPFYNCSYLQPITVTVAV